MSWAFESIEDDILHLIIKDREFAVLVINELKSDYFVNDTYRAMFTVMQRYFDEFKGIPDLDILKSMIAATDKFSENFDVLESERVFNDVQLEPQSIEYIRNTIPKFIKNGKFKKAITSVVSRIEDLDNPLKQDDVFNTFGDDFKKIMMYNMDQDLGHNIYDVEGRYDTLRERYSGGIRPASKTLQRYIRGYFPGEVYAYFGESGVGKSILLINDAIAAMKQGKNVVFITMELRDKNFGLRADQNISEKKSRVLLSEETKIQGKSSVEYLKERYAEVKKLTGGDMWIKEFSHGGASMSDVERYIEMLMIYENFKPDLIVTDYAGIMKPNAGKGAKKYEDLEEILNEHENTAKSLEMPVLTALQANRPPKSEDKGGSIYMLDSSRLADSYGVKRPLTGLYSINRGNSEEQMLHKHYLFLEKNRNGIDQIKIPVIIRKDVMRVEDDAPTGEEEEN